MSTFKDIVELDSQVFFNNDEFSSIHKINGNNISIVIDDDKLIEKTQKDFSGMSIGEILYYVNSKDFGELPEVDTPQNFDDRYMYVASAVENCGVYEIILRQNRGA